MNEISDLKEDVELKFGRSIPTPAVFDTLYLDIKKTTGKEVSVSTLKRFWGYVKADHKPRQETLSILSQYLGYKDWNDYIGSKKSHSYSDFLREDILESKRLSGGEIIQIAWAPRRECELKYLGDSLFEVVKSRNSKIIEGDIFSCSVMAKGEHMLCHSIKRDGKLFADCYIAAKHTGLEEISIKGQS